MVRVGACGRLLEHMAGCQGILQGWRQGVGACHRVGVCGRGQAYGMVGYMCWRWGYVVGCGACGRVWVMWKGVGHVAGCGACGRLWG